MSRREWPQQGRATSALAALSQRAGVSSPLLRLQVFCLAQGKTFRPARSPCCSSRSSDGARRQAGRLCLAPRANSGYVNKNAQQHTQGMYYNRPQQHQEMPARPFILSVLFSVVGEELQRGFAHTEANSPSVFFSLSRTHTHTRERTHTHTPR